MKDKLTPEQVVALSEGTYAQLLTCFEPITVGIISSNMVAMAMRDTDTNNKNLKKAIRSLEALKTVTINFLVAEGFK